MNKKRICAVAKIVCLVFIFTNSNLIPQSVKLNRYGGFEILESKQTVERTRINDNFFLKIGDYLFEGNESIITDYGVITISASHETTPTLLRFYTHDAKLVFQKKYGSIINSMLSQNHQYFVFSNGEKIIKLNLLDLTEDHLPFSNYVSVTNKGEIVKSSLLNNEFSNDDKIYYTQSKFRAFISLNNFDLVFCENGVYSFIDSNLKLIHNFSDTFFDVIPVENEIFYSIRARAGKDFVFKLFKIDNNMNITQVEEFKTLLPHSFSHNEIRSPLKYNLDDYPHPIGNSYGEIQYYGGSPYLHPGVDFLGADNENVYAVKSGIVKAKITTGGAAYWRLGIADNFTADTSVGYLYAHLNQNSIPYVVGDTIQAGDFLGTLYPWGFADFTHIHFGRIISAGEIWSGKWLTLNNPLPDIINMKDTIPPVIENVFSNQLFAYRKQDGSYIDQYSLNGKVRMIAKSFDYANSYWKIDSWKFLYKIREAGPTFSDFGNYFAFAFDMPLDVYQSTSPLSDFYLKTVYSRDDQCYSNGNYDVREYYHIISNSNGKLNENIIDSNYLFDTRNLPNGDYEITLTVVDASLNQTSAADYFVVQNQAPEIPTLLNGISGDTILYNSSYLNLAIIPGVAEFLVQISKDSSFSVIDTQFISSNNFKVSEISTNYKYYWRAASIGLEGISSFSMIGSFFLAITSSIYDFHQDFSFELSQNYPNPFNPSTRIFFTIPEDTKVRLALINSLGQEIKVLLNEYKNKGKYEYHFDAGSLGLSSGIYFYALLAEDRFSIRKMLYLK